MEKMVSPSRFPRMIVICCLLILTAVESFADGSSCTESCVSTYSPHTFEKGYMNTACQHGCNLYVLACRHSIHTPMDQCKKGCNSSYASSANKAETVPSCYQGCTFMKPLEDERVKTLDKTAMEARNYEAQARFHFMVDNLLQNMFRMSLQREGMDPDHSFMSHVNRFFIKTNSDAQPDIVITTFVVDEEPVRNQGKLLVEGQQGGRLGGDEEYREIGVVHEAPCHWWRKLDSLRYLCMAAVLFMLIGFLWLCCSTANARIRKKAKQQSTKAVIKYHRDLDYLITAKQPIPEGITVQAFPLPEKSAKL